VKKKILIGVGLYLAAGVVTAAVLARQYPALSSKLEAVALWPGWIFVRLRQGGARAEHSSPGLSPVGAAVDVPKHQLTDQDRQFMREQGIAWRE